MNERKTIHSTSVSKVTVSTTSLPLARPPTGRH